MVAESDFKIAGDYNVDYVLDKDREYAGAIKRLKELKPQSGGDIWLAGDNRLIWAFLENDMVDEIVLTMLPVTIGHGAKLFPDTFQENKWYVWNKAYYENGVVQVTYRVTSPDAC